MSDASTPPAGSGEPAAPPRPAPVPGDERSRRIEWLFRDALRRRQLHPLMLLLRRYRGVDAP